MNFYPDSLVFKFPGVFDEKTDWKANESQIEFELPTFDWDSLGKPRDTVNKILIEYELSAEKDSLFGTLKNNYGLHKFSMLKTSNYDEFLKKKFGVQFTLPEIDSTEIIKKDPVNGMKIFMTSVNNKIISKTELSNSLENLENDIKKFKNRLETFYGSKDLRVERFYLSVYADKGISDSIITASLPVTFKSDFFINNNIPRPPGDKLPIWIYRIYNNDKNNNLRFRKAKKIKSFAYTTYR